MLALRDLSHDPNLAEALGNMVVAWAYAEETLIFSLARVADINLNMALAGLHRLPTFESRIKFIRALISEWKPPSGFDKEASRLTPGIGRGRIAKIAKPTIEISDKVRLNLEKFV
jgi:hypothetical protein